MWWRTRTPKVDSALGNHAQRELVLDELSRQLEDVMARQSNALARGSIVVAAAAATSLALLTTLSSLWMIAPIVAGTISAVFGFSALWLWRSKAAKLTSDLADTYAAAPLRPLQERFIRDRAVELASARKDLDRKNAFIKIAMIFAALSWVSAILVAALDTIHVL